MRIGKPRQVVMINLRGHSSPLHIMGAGNSLAVRTIEQGLRERGAAQVISYPDREIFFDAHAVRNDLRAMLAPQGLSPQHEDVVFGISLDTEDYSKFTTLSEILREEFPGAMIVAGGPHFRRELNLVDANGTRYPDPIEDALMRRLADAVVVGHCDPFIKFVTEGRDTADFSDPGFYRLVNGEVAGSGAGGYPKLEKIPYVPSPAGNGVILALDDRCANRCGYCTINKKPLGFSDDQFRAAYDELIGESEIARVHFVDSNLAEPNRLGHFKRLTAIMAEVERKHGSSAHKMAMLDPSTFTGPAANEITRGLLVHNFDLFFLGREVISAASAARIGSNFLGAPKDQPRLDNERERLKWFIERLRGARNAVSRLKYKLTIAYLLDPFSTLEETLGQLDEMRMFETMSVKGVEISTYFGALVPFPGTKLRKKYLDSIYQPGNFNLLSSNMNSWRYSAGPTSAIINQLLYLQARRGAFDLFSALAGRHKRLSPLRYYAVLKRAARETFLHAKENPPAEDLGRVKYYHPVRIESPAGVITQV